MVGTAPQSSDTQVAQALEEAQDAARVGRMEDVVRAAKQAIALQVANAGAWRILGLACEALGDFSEALAAYETALSLTPGDADLLKGLARLALEMDLPAAALGLARQAQALVAADAEAVHLIARSLAREGHVQEATEVLVRYLDVHPDTAEIWNALGVLASDSGDSRRAETAFTQAVRLEPGMVAARFNLANLRINEGEPDRALTDIEAISEIGLSAREAATLRFARACIHLQLGDLKGGWRDYAARNDPASPGGAAFDFPGRRWLPGEPLQGLDLLLIGEQGVGDEVLFSSLVPDLMGGSGRPRSLSLAAEPRLVSLFQRSFPGVAVIPHATIETAGRRIRRLETSASPPPSTAWTPIGDLLPLLRPDLKAFPDRERYLIADPARVLESRAWLSSVAKGLRVGLIWKSAVMSGARRLAFADFEAWSPILQTPGASFINLQYGDVSEEISFSGNQLGVDILTPDIDLKADLDGVAALSCALDLVIGVSNASFNLAGACGARTWLITAPDAWPVLGADHYPWYPQVRIFPSRRLGDWSKVLEDVSKALAAEIR